MQTIQKTKPYIGTQDVFFPIQTKSYKCPCPLLQMTAHGDFSVDSIINYHRYYLDVYHHTDDRFMLKQMSLCNFHIYKHEIKEIVGNKRNF